MKTITFKINPQKPNPTLINKAAHAIRSGKLVAFPTETVYGLGANALDPTAVAKIFEAKNRPLDDPLIVHIADKKDLSKLAKSIPEHAKKLIKEFWPGPLTIILEKKDTVPDIVTAGLDTVAVRMPANAIALALIKKAGVPVAAPSANMFSRTSPVSAKHVMDDLAGKVDIVIDGGRSEIGVESTVLDLTGRGALVLRPGGITAGEIKDVVKERITINSRRSKRSPGTYRKHYAPSAKVLIIKNDPAQVKKVLLLVAALSKKGLDVGIMCKREHKKSYASFNAKEMGPANDLKKCAAELFHILREFDKDKVDVIIAEAVSEKGLGLAIMNRLKKAAAE